MQSLAFNHNCSRTVGRGWNCSYRSPTYIVRLFEVDFRTRFNSPASRILFDNLSGLVPTVVMFPGFGPMNLSTYTCEPSKTTIMIWPMKTSGTIPDLCDLPWETRHFFVKHVPNIWKDGHSSGPSFAWAYTKIRNGLIAVYCQHWVFHIKNQVPWYRNRKPCDKEPPWSRRFWDTASGEPSKNKVSLRLDRA